MLLLPRSLSLLSARPSQTAPAHEVLDRREAVKNLDAHRKNRRSLIALVMFASLLAAVFGIMSGAAQSPAKEEREVEDRVPKHLPIKVKVKKEKEEKVKDLSND